MIRDSKPLEHRNAHYQAFVEDLIRQIKRHNPSMVAAEVAGGMSDPGGTPGAAGAPTSDAMHGPEDAAGPDEPCSTPSPQADATPIPDGSTSSGSVSGVKAHPPAALASQEGVQQEVAGVPLGQGGGAGLDAMWQKSMADMSLQVSSLAASTSTVAEQVISLQAGLAHESEGVRQSLVGVALRH